MTHAELETRLQQAVLAHDLLCHPFYQAWTAGTLRREDLSAYAAQYRHQVDALAGLLRTALGHTEDAQTRQSVLRNLAEETGQSAPSHRELWDAFAAAVGPTPEEEPLPHTLASTAQLREAVKHDEVQALAALWAYEWQTSRVAGTKYQGLAARYGVTEPSAVAFFTLHEKLDVHHANDLLAGLCRAIGADEAKVNVALGAATASAKAQWTFLDGVEARRLNAAR